MSQTRKFWRKVHNPGVREDFRLPLYENSIQAIFINYSRYTDKYYLSSTRHLGFLEGHLRKELGEITPYNVREKLIDARSLINEWGEQSACPICRKLFSSSVAHLASHVTAVNERADFGTYWEVPSGASGEKNFRFNPEVPENFKPRLIGIVAEYHAERVAYGGPVKRGVISAIFGA